MSLDSLLKASHGAGVGDSSAGDISIDLSQVYTWMRDNSLNLHPQLIALAEATKNVERNQMISSPEQMQFFQLLFKIMGVKNAIEVGTYTGFGTLAMSLALPEDGQIITCDINEVYPSIGKPFWEHTGQLRKVILRIGPANQTLGDLLTQGKERFFDFAFIDCNKEQYDEYYELCLKLIRSNGIIAVDNTLWGGKVAYPTFTDEQTTSMRNLILKMHTDKRIEQVMLPIGDGLTLARVL